MKYIKDRNIKRGFTVIRRIKPGEIEKFQNRIAHYNFITSNDINRRYKGIEGEHWPDDLNEEVFSEIDFEEISFDEVFNFYKRIKTNRKDDNIDLLFFEIGIEDKLELKGCKNFKFYGYDYGVFISKWNAYSIIFNEVLFGKYQELWNSSMYLNEYLLFPSLETLSILREIRERLIVVGSDLETAENEDEIPKAIAVFGFEG